MPRQIINYENAVIYKLVCNDVNIKNCYVGSTTNFAKRKQAHKGACNNINNNAHNINVYQFIRDNEGWSNWDMVLIEKFKCEDKLELLKKERYYIELLNASLNSKLPSRTKNEYAKTFYKEHNEQKREYHATYRENNRDKIREYREQNKEQINLRRKELRQAAKLK